MKKTSIINIKSGERYDEWVGKGSQWEMPPHIKGTIEEQIAEYEKWIQEQSWLMEDIPLLKGKILACSCKPKPCHGDVLVRLADGIEVEEEPEYQERDGIWYITHNEKEICLNTEETAKMLLRLLKKEVDK